MAAALGAAMVLAPILATLTASPAEAASPVATPVGSLADNSGDGLTSLNVSPQNLGDVLVVAAIAGNTGVSVSTVSGGGVTTWARAVQYDGVNEPRDMEIWYGKVTTTGSSSITFTWSGSISSVLIEYNAQEFTAGLGSSTVWSLDKTGHSENASSTTVSYPSLTPAAAGELYFGFVDLPNAPSAGSTTGFTYVTAAAANQIAYDPDTGSGAVAPTSSQSPAGVSSSVAALLTVSGTSSGVISAIGSLVTVKADGLTTASDNPQIVGDLMVVMAEEDNNTVHLTSVTGGGVTTWHTAITYNGVGEPRHYELWYGQVTATGSSTITFTWSGSITTQTAEYEVQEFTAGLGSGSVWSLDKTGTIENASSTTVTYPSLTPTSAGELYFGYVDLPETPSAGSTLGFTYATTADANQIAYDPDCGSGAVQPTSSQSPAAVSSALAMLISVSTGTPPTPTVTGVSPNSGLTTGGTSVTVTGTSFTGATAVKFGTTAATSFTVNSATQITATSPAESAATVHVTVTGPGGTSATTSADQFTYVAPVQPTVTGVSPSTGSTVGGTSVTVTGTGFTGATAVKFGTISASTFTVNGATSITATSPAESAATVDVTVTTPGGTSPVNAPADQFTFAVPPAPTVTGVSPNTGSTAGGTSVTVTGTGFTGATAVKFGTTAATSFTVNSATQVTATSPAESAGTVHVTVTGPGGTSTTSTADQFTFALPPPVITAVGTLTSSTGSGVTTLAVTPQTVGDVQVVFAEVGTTGHTVSSVSGGGVATWTKGVQFTGTGGVDTEIWFGKVTTTGASTVTFTWSSSIAGFDAEYGAQEFSAGLGANAVWALDKSGTSNGASSTTVPFPTLAPAGTGELYFGYAEVANSASNGTTSGFTFQVTTNGNDTAYDTNVSGSVAPTATQSPAGVSTAVGVLLTVSNTPPPPAPTVTAVGTTSGSTAGGTSVSITGTNFTGATAVMFGTTAATSFTVNSPTSITATSPAEPAWQVDLTVTTPGGTSATSSADRFTFKAAAPVATGTPHVMVVMMENEAYSDLIGSADAPNINQLAQDYGVATQSYAIAHPSLPNYLEMISGSSWGVTDDGTPQSENLSAADSTIANQLEAAGIPWRAYLEDMPSAGYTGGDTGGTDPYGGDYYLQHHNPFVYFPAVTSLPDFAANVVPFTNMTSDLNSATPPAFVWVTPNAVDDMHDGPAMADGDTVPTAGDAWLGGFIGSVQASSWYAAGGQIIVQWDEGASSDTSGVGTAVPGGGHTVSLVVSSALQASPQQDATSVNTAGVLHSIERVYGLPSLLDAGNSSNGNIDSMMTLSPPTVTGVSPPSGFTTGATSVTITGTNFTGATAVKFGTTAATSFTVNSATSISATSPAESAATVDVTVTGPGGTSPVNAPADQFTFTAPPVPTVTGVSPTSGSTAGGTTVTVTGTGFTGTTVVKFGTVAGTGLVVNSSTSITITSPAESASTVDVTVTTPGGTSATNPPADQFMFVAPPVPTVTGVSPTSGSTAGGTTVTVTGTGFTGATVVKFGTVAGTGLVVNSSTSITITSPAESASTVDVTVTTPAGTSATNPPADQFMFVAPPVPTVTGVSPTSGSTAGGTTVTVTGTGFTGATVVKFGTVAGTGLVVNSSTSITITSPAESASTVDVTVTTPAGTSATNPPADQFMFVAPPVPTVTGVSPTSGSTAGGTTVTVTGTGFTGATVGEVRHGGGHGPGGQLLDLDHHHLPGGVRLHRGRDGHHPGGHLGGQCSR